MTTRRCNNRLRGMGPLLIPLFINRFGVGLFAYQSLDAIDGKQARRTGASGPLGELFGKSTIPFI